MNLSEIVHDNVWTLVNDSTSPIQIQDMDELKRWVKGGWKVIDTTRRGKYIKHGMHRAVGIPYALYGDRYARTAASKTGFTEGYEFEKAVLEEQKIFYEKGTDFTNEFVHKFKGVPNLNVIILAEKREHLSRALQGLQVLEPTMNFGVGVYIPKKYDFPFEYA